MYMYSHNHKLLNIPFLILTFLEGVAEPCESRAPGAPTGVPDAEEEASTWSWTGEGSVVRSAMSTSSFSTLSVTERDDREGEERIAWS